MMHFFVLLSCALLQSYDDFYNASIHTATLKVIGTVLIATGILYLSSLLKLSSLFAHFLHASNLTVMIISSYLRPVMRKPVYGFLTRSDSNQVENFRI